MTLRDHLHRLSTGARLMRELIPDEDEQTQILAGAAASPAEVLAWVLAVQDYSLEGDVLTKAGLTDEQWACAVANLRTEDHTAPITDVWPDGSAACALPHLQIGRLRGAAVHHLAHLNPPNAQLPFAWTWTTAFGEVSAAPYSGTVTLRNAHTILGRSMSVSTDGKKCWDHLTSEGPQEAEELSSTALTLHADSFTLTRTRLTLDPDPDGTLYHGVQTTITLFASGGGQVHVVGGPADLGRMVQELSAVDAYLLCARTETANPARLAERLEFAQKGGHLLIDPPPLPF